MTAADDYSARVRRLFADPPHAGDLPAGPGRVVAAGAQALDRGAWLEISACLEAGVVARARFRAWGCPHFIAACELAVAGLEGRPAAAGAGTRAADLAGELGVPAGKLGRLLVIEDALQALAAAAGRSQ